MRALTDRFPPGHHYLVELASPGQMDRALKTILVDPVGMRAPSFWKGGDIHLAETGKRVGWVPESMPPFWFSVSAAEELALSLAARRGSVRASMAELSRAESILKALGLTRLLRQPPVTLSRGEAKTVRILAQWLKTPGWLFVDHFLAGLAPSLAQKLLVLLTTEKAGPVLVLGVMAQEAQWIRQRGDWVKISGDGFEEVA